MGPGLGYHGPRNTKEEEEETMAHYVTGPAIKALRERKGLTQKQLAEQILEFASSFIPAARDDMTALVAGIWKRR